MLSYKNRFHGYGSLAYVYKKGQPVRNHLFTIKAVRNKQRTDTRIAVVVSKKVLKSAVGRNRIRRRLYEQLRQQLPNIQETWDIACIVSSSELRTYPADELGKLVAESLSELGITEQR